MKLVQAKVNKSSGHVTLTFRSPGGQESTRRLGPRGLLSVLEAVQIAKVSRMRIYRMIGRGELKSVMQGRVRMISVSEVLKLAS